LTGQAVIELEDVWAGYESDRVLEAVNFRMEAGDYVGLIGPNGGGKTTLIKVILGLIKPERGSVRVMGVSPEKGATSSAMCLKSSRMTRTFRSKFGTW